MKTFPASKQFFWILFLGLSLSLLGTPAAQAQTFTVLLSFNGMNGAGPDASLVRGGGNLYGTTVSGGDMQGCSGFGCGTVFELNRSGQKVLYTFKGGTDGSYPIAGVIRDSAGNLYGTTSGGGVGFGVVFKLDPAGTETVLHTFTGVDGEWPHTGVIRDAAGNLYGTTASGGAFHGGVVYKLDTNNNFSVLYNFMGGTDGVTPQAALTQDRFGNLYGTTTYGGAHGCGVVFALDPGGHETLLYSFTGGTDGSNPYAGVTFDKAGNLYGTTQGGGDLSKFAYGYGVVYQLHKTLGFRVLYAFTGGTDGGSPESGVIVESTGEVYGTTLVGGNLACSINNTVGCGVVYELDATGQETVLHTFAGADGGYNQANLIRGAGGDLYSTSASGGALGLGVIFRIKP